MGWGGCAVPAPAVRQCEGISLMKPGLLLGAAAALAIWAPIPGVAVAATPCMSGLEAAVLSTVNRARVDPRGFAATLRLEYSPAQNSETVAFLRHARPIAPLVCDARLAAAARAHVADQGPFGGLSHVGSDGSTAMERMQRRRLYASIYAEVMSAGFSDPNGVVSQLIIDPEPGHRHRVDLFDPALKAAGVACGPNANYGTMCVIDLTSRPMSPGGEGAREIAARYP
jgi:uncharacterized protein YkwD